MPAAPQTQMTDFVLARFNMVEAQLRPNKVRSEPLLNAMGSLPREYFVPMPMTNLAYIDEDIQVYPGRYLLEPMILARLIEEAKVKPTDRVLDVAPATGYSSAVLAEIAAEVIAVEGDVKLAKAAEAALAQLQIKKVRVEQGNIVGGFPAGAPYDVILINGCIEVIPEALFVQLAEGGRLVAVIRHTGQVAHVGEARLYEKLHGNISHRSLFNANVKLLAEFAAKPQFVF